MKVGMIGGGSWADRHLKAWQAASYEIAAIYNRTRTRAERLAETFGIPDVCDDWREIVARDDIEIVSISMPHNMHYEMSLAAIDAGKHVYCEKPLAMNYAEAKEMHDKAAAAGVKTGMQYNPRNDPALIRLSELVRDGRIGDVTSIAWHSASDFCADPMLPMMWRFDKNVAGTGALGDMGTYLIDTCRWVLGEFEAVAGIMTTHIHERPVAPENFDMFENLAYARDNKINKETPDTTRMARVTNEDEVLFLARLANGVVGEFKVSRVNADPRFVVFGSEGVIQRDAAAGKLFCKLRGHQAFEEVELPEPNPDATIASHFVANLEQGTDAGPTFYDGMKNMAVIDAVVRSTEEHRWVEIREIETG